MFKLIIKNENTGFLYTAQLETEQLINDHANMILSMVDCYIPQREIIALSEEYSETDALSSRVEVVSAILDENNVEIQPEQVINYVTLKSNYIIEITDITAEVEAAQLKAARIAEGKKARQCCEEILDYIGGFNVERDLSLAQIQQMLVDFANVYSALKANMPKEVKRLALAIQPTELVSQELLDETMVILAKYGY